MDDPVDPRHRQTPAVMALVARLPARFVARRLFDRWLARPRRIARRRLMTVGRILIQAGLKPENLLLLPEDLFLLLPGQFLKLANLLLQQTNPLQQRCAASTSLCRC